MYSDELNNFIVLLDGGEEQALSSASADSPEPSSQEVYVTSLLLVNQKQETNKQNQIEQVVGDDLNVEDRLHILNAMLPPPSERVNKRSRSSGNNITIEAADYKCDLCGSEFQQPEQYFGHLRTHSGEHFWECSSCPPGKSLFASSSRLRQHEKTRHLCLRSHKCSLCPAAYERLSQLESHHKRIHEVEKNHVCQLCSKAFYKRSDLRTHLSVHLGLQRRVCEVCGRSFSHVSNLIRHGRLHTGVKPFPCTICGRRFNQGSTLAVHRLTHNSERQSFPCPVGLCSRDFRSRTIAIRHARRLHPEAAIFDDPTNVKQQQRRKYVCAACGETFDKAYLLRNHEDEHEELRCTSCNETFLSMNDLKAHGCSGLVDVVPEETKNVNLLENLEDEMIQDGSQVFPAVVEVTGSTVESFLFGSILLCVDNNSMEVQPEESVPKVGGMLQLTPEGTVTLSDPNMEPAPTLITTLPFTPEMSTLPDPEPDPSLAFFITSPIKEDPDSIPDPPSSVPLLTFHPHPTSLPSPSSFPLQSSSAPVIINGDGEAKVIIPRLPPKSSSSSSDPVSQNPSPTKVGGVTCSECGKQFRKSSSLKQHMGTHFAEKQLHRCDVCSQTFAWKSSLRKHVASHFPDVSASQKATCPDCGKEFSTNALVQEHVRRDHLLERSHCCNICSKSFYKRHDLVTHLRVHTKEKPYMCGTCGKTFTHVSHMKRHELIHRGVKNYECEVCKARFRQTSGLKAHIMRNPACSGLAEVVDDINTAAEDKGGET